MPDPVSEPLVEILCVLDRSGSMETIRDDAIGGFHAFLDAQREVPGEARLTLVLFDHEYLVLHEGVPLEQVPSLTRQTFQPRGQTALLDALGRALDDLNDRHLRMPPEDRPDQVVMVIITDGAENASQTFTRDLVFQDISALQARGWRFLFLAANQDAIAAGGELGIGPGGTVDFQATGQGTRDAFAAVTRVVTEARTLVFDPPTQGEDGDEP